MKKNEFITTSSLQTQKLGALLAQELRGGEVLCLAGDLGAGKTTFTQGLLKELGAAGPYTSPTFTIMKEYKIKNQESEIRKKSKKAMLHDSKFMIQRIYHIDAYRIDADGITGLGWQDFAGKPNTVVLVEWPENIKRVLPKNALWLKFEWLDEKSRKISLGTQH